MASYSNVLVKLLRSYRKSPAVKMNKFLNEDISDLTKNLRINGFDNINLFAMKRVMDNEDIIEISKEDMAKLKKDDYMNVEKTDYLKLLVCISPISIFKFVDNKIVMNFIFSSEYYCNFYFQMYFRNVVKNKDYLYEYLSDKFKLLVDDAKKIVDFRNKRNTLEGNTDLDYELVAKVYPIVGEEYTNDILDYDTGVTSEIASLRLFENGIYLIKEILKFNEETKLIDEGSKNIHYLFSNISDKKKLYFDILEHREELDDKLLKRLKSIIMNNNLFGIKSFEELVNYDQVIFDRVIFYTNNGRGHLDYPNLLAVCLSGINSLSDLSKSFKGYGLNNLANYKFVLREVKDKIGEEGIKEFIFTKEEAQLIILINKIINLPESSDIINTFKDIRDYSYIYMDIVDKVRRLYSKHFDLSLTRVSDVKKNYIKDIDGIKIYELGNGKYDFLAHRICNFDLNNQDDYLTLLKDPSAWMELEGSSSISLSTYSNNGSYVVYDRFDGVYFIFDNVPQNFLLYMSDHDLTIEHGKRLLLPNAYKNEFSSFQGLKQRSGYGPDSWNEVAGWREGMIPSAIMVNTMNIPETAIKAAKYFSEVSGKEVPILYSCMEEQYVHERKSSLKDEYNKLKKDFKEEISLDKMNNIIYSGCIYEENDNDSLFVLTSRWSDLSKKIGYILKCLEENYNLNKIQFNDLISYLNQLYYYVDDVFGVEFDNAKKSLEKIKNLYKYLCYYNHIFSSDISNLKFANFFDFNKLFSFTANNTNYEVTFESFNHKERLLGNQAYYKAVRRLDDYCNVKMSPLFLIKEDKDGLIILSEKIENDNKREIDKELNNDIISDLWSLLIIDYLTFSVNTSLDNFVLGDDNRVFKLSKDCNLLKNHLSNRNDLFMALRANQTLYGRVMRKVASSNGEYNFDGLRNVASSIELLTDQEFSEIFKELIEWSYYPDETRKALLERKQNLSIKVEELIGLFNRHYLKK